MVYLISNILQSLDGRKINSFEHTFFIWPRKLIHATIKLSNEMQISWSRKFLCCRTWHTNNELAEVTLVSRQQESIVLDFFFFCKQSVVLVLPCKLQFAFKQSIVLVLPCKLHFAPSILPPSKRLSHSPTPKQTVVKSSYVDGDIVPPLKVDVRLCSLSRWFPISIFKLYLVRYPMDNKYGTVVDHVFGATSYRRRLIEKAR